jgi:ferredoxin
MKAIVDMELCCGKGLCVVNCPAVFELVDGKAAVKMGEIPLDLQEMCEMAVLGCPTNAISIEE